MTDLDVDRSSPVSLNSDDADALDIARRQIEIRYIDTHYHIATTIALNISLLIHAACIAYYAH